MNNLTRNILVVVLIAIAAGGGGYWFFSNFELRPFDTDAGYSRQARENRYLAMGYFLEASGVEVENVAGRALLDNLPPTSDTLFLSYNSSALSMRRQQALRDWLERGGNLVTVVSSDWEETEQTSEQRFFDQFGIQRHPYHETTETNAQEEEPRQDDQDTDYVPVHFASYEQPVRVDFARDAYFVDANDQASARISDEAGITLLQYDVGDGRLTVLTDAHFWENRHIGEHDHALFAWLLMGEASPRVWVMYDISLPSLLSSAWTKAPHAAIAFAALLGIWLWGLYDRFGPTCSVEDRSRRSLTEHLYASGRFHWRANRAETLVEHLQVTVRAKLEKAHPGWSHLPQQKQLEWLSARSFGDEDQLLFALDDKPSDERSFLRCVHRLQNLHKLLS